MKNTKQKSIPKFALSVLAKNLTAKLFCFLLFFTFYFALNNKIGLVLTQILDSVILVIVMFSTSWDIGSGDENRVKTGALKEDVFRGFKAGFLGSLPDFLLAAFLMLVKIFDMPKIWTSIFGILDAPFYPFVLTVLPQTRTVSEQSFVLYLICALTVLFVPLISGLAYMLGYRQFSILDHVIYTTPESREKHKQKLIARDMKKKNRYYR